MGTKRHHRETKSGTELISDPNKRVKSNESTSHDNLPVNDSIIIQQLKDVVDQIVGHPQLLQGYPGGAEIAKMTTQLHTRLVENEESGTSTKSNKTRPPLHAYPDLPNLPCIRDPSLEKAVFTHPATPKNTASKGQETNYDRLEVLGDAYIELMATRLIWDQCPGLPAGRISQIREDLIKNETIAGFASQYGFDRRVNAPEDHRSPARKWIKVRGDVFEAYVAAVILSNPLDGFDMAEKWLRQLWLPRLAHIPQAQRALKYKEQLSKKVMGSGIRLRYVDERPPEQLDGGMQTFYIGVYLTGWGWNDQHLGSGSGLNKAIAGDQAAERALRNSPLIEQVAAAKAAFDRQASSRKDSREKELSLA